MRAGAPLSHPMSSSCCAPPLQFHPRHAPSCRHSPLLHPFFPAIPARRPHHTPLARGALPRRLFLPSASFLWDAVTGGTSAREASSAVRRGMVLFRQGDVGGSLAEFDRAIELDPRQKSHLWQRGLSLYYLNRFEEGAEQFRIDVAANPNDTEESIWCFLCEAQLYGVEEARRRFLQVGRDPRPYMHEAYNMFKDGGDPEKNDPDSAKRHILAACESPYGVSSGDYMASLARVHCLCRNWMPGQ